jgi:RND family efflux transporter MFP subunit
MRRSIEQQLKESNRMKFFAIVFGVVLAGGAGVWMFYAEKDHANTPVNVTCIEARKSAFVVSVRAEGRLLSRKTETVRALSAGIIRDEGIANGVRVVKGARLAMIQPLEEVRKKKQIELELAELDLALITEQRLQAEELLQAKAASEREVNELKIRQRRQEAQVQSLREELSEKIVSAPFAGLLVEKRFQHGDRINADAELFTLVDTQTLIIEAKMHQSDLPKVRLGQSAVLRSEIFQRAHVGKVVEIASMTAQQNNEGLGASNSSFFNVYAQIDGLATEELRLGAHVEVEVILAEKPNTLSVPLECVHIEGAEENEVPRSFSFNPFAPRGYSQLHDGRAMSLGDNGAARLLRHVFVNDNGVARKRAITTGAANEHAVEVLSGLREEELVIVAAPVEIQDDMKVTRE